MTELVMPAAPKGAAWELEFEVVTDHIWLWLRGPRRRSRDGLERVMDANGSWSSNLRISTATVDQIVEGTIVAAHKMLTKIGEVPERQAMAQAKADEISRRLGGIKIVIK